MTGTEVAAPWLRRIGRGLRVVIAISIVAALLHFVGPAEVRARLAACPPSVALAGLAAALLGQWFAALRFERLARTQGLPLSRIAALGINLSTAFYGLFLPGGTATSWLVRLLRMPGAKQQLGLALTVIAADRAFATVAGALIGIVADVTLRVPATPLLTLAFGLVAAGSGAVGWALLTPAGGAWSARWRDVPWLRTRAGQVPVAAAERQAPTLATVAIATALSAAVHGLGILVWWALARALGLELGLVEIAWTRSAALAVGLLPVTVGGLGLREGTVVVLLAAFGVPAADALSLSLLAFTVTVLGVGVVGGIAEAGRMLQQRDA